MRQISRRQMATYAAEAISLGRKGVIEQLAAYLKETSREKEIDLLVRDIEKALQAHGIFVTRVKTAHALNSSQRAEIEGLIKERYKARRVEIATSEDSDLLGGVVISTAGDELDGSLRRNINRLRVIKV